ncbi:MAG: helix-turn-helix transcriptional regulator [Mariprofundaceae bacterium]|nr:helix-turn-helix transcriptional regulator [Mariprofundaceae bacterium]
MAAKVINGVGKRIQQARLAVGLNQSQLALKLNIKPQSVQNWERGRSLPKTARIEEVATVLHVTSAWLLLGDKKDTMQEHAEDLHHDEMLLVRMYRRMNSTHQAVFVEIAGALANKKDDG